MKKIRLPVIFVVLCALLLSCGGLQNLHSIDAMDYICEQNISIKMRVRKAAFGGSYTNFAIDKNIEELADAIAETDPTLSIKIYQEKYIGIQTQSNWFLIEQEEKLEADRKSDSRYMLFAPIGAFEIVSDAAPASAYIPYHLLTGIDVQYYPDSERAYPKTFTCQAADTIDAFYDFYDHIAWCAVTKETDRLVITCEENQNLMYIDFSQNGTVTFSIIQSYSYVEQD